MSYRNIAYNPKDESMRLFSWDAHGNRVSYDVTFNPYLYIESQNSPDAVSIFNTPVKKRVFKNQFERSKFIKESNMRRVFGNLTVNQQFLIRLDCFLLTHFGFAYFPFFGMALRVIAVMLLLSRFSVP